MTDTPIDVEAIEARLKVLAERDRLRAALQWAVPLAAIALENHRQQRNKYGLNGDITYTDSTGQKCVGLWQSEYDDLTRARAALASRKEVET